MPHLTIPVTGAALRRHPRDETEVVRDLSRPSPVGACRMAIAKCDGYGCSVRRTQAWNQLPTLRTEECCTVVRESPTGAGQPEQESAVGADTAQPRGGAVTFDHEFGELVAEVRRGGAHLVAVGPPAVGAPASNAAVRLTCAR